MKNVVNPRDHCSPESVYSGLQADKEIADSTTEAPLRNSARSYAAVAVSGPAHIASRSKEFADRGIILVSNIEEDSDGFKTVIRRRKTTTGAPAVVTVKHCQQPLIGVRNTISKKERFSALFVSRFSPDVTADDVEKSLK
jgi:hypothetical protein